MLTIDSAAARRTATALTERGLGEPAGEQPHQARRTVSTITTVLLWETNPRRHHALSDPVLASRQRHEFVGSPLTEPPAQPVQHPATRSIDYKSVHDQDRLVKWSSQKTLRRPLRGGASLFPARTIDQNNRTATGQPVIRPAPQSPKDGGPSSPATSCHPPYP